MSRQRRRGVRMTIWRTAETTDRRGNAAKGVTDEAPHEVIGWEIPQRSARGEVPGQLKINVIRIGVPADLEGVELWSRVEIEDKQYDIVTPPALHRGTRHVRHWSIDLRQRP